MVVYGDGATFVPKCPVCARYVKPYKRVKVDFEGQPKGPNAKCKVHGKVQMLWQGYY